MNTVYRHILEKGSKKHLCPDCKKRTFVKYIDIETGHYLPDTVGRCDRESSCGFHHTPKQYLQNCRDIAEIKPYIKPKAATKPKAISLIPVDVFKGSLKNYEANHFIKYLFELLGTEIASQLISRYFIGTSKHWPGATVFWQIDSAGKIRTGKIMLYSPSTGKRVKEPFNHISWVHKLTEQPEFNLQQCLFGTHLLLNNTKPCAIFESEKTAIIASVYFPQFICLAVGSLTNLNAEKCSILKGRSVTLFPDLNGFEKWSSKAKELSHITRFMVSDLLERNATEAERKQGLDLADYLIKFNFKDFTLPEPGATEPPPAVQPLVEVKPFEQTEPVYYFSKPELPKLENWEQDITELENYFTGITLPTQPVKLNRCSTITNCSLFIESHFATVKAYKGNTLFSPYLNRLHELKHYIILNKK